MFVTYSETDIKKINFINMYTHKKNNVSFLGFSVYHILSSILNTVNNVEEFNLCCSLTSLLNNCQLHTDIPFHILYSTLKLVNLLACVL
jgi:hypothetical protein